MPDEPAAFTPVIDENAIYDAYAERPPHIHFGLFELAHLALAVVALSFAFSFALTGQGLLRGAFDWNAVITVLPYSALIVVTAFVLHELAHKFVAQRYRMEAEFRASMPGLGLGFVLSLLTGFVLALPGAVVIFGYADERESGLISIFGPSVNIVLAALGLGFLVGAPSLDVHIGLTGTLFENIVFINLFLAGFNMLPIPPLDGSKVWKWSKLGFAAMWVLVVVGFYGLVTLTPAFFA
ncbi:MAG: zinc metalloprotease [Thermoplasmatota archaeon]